MGLWRPAILMPPALLQSLSPEQLRFVFLHELAHVRCRDIAVNWLLLALSAMHWFNPLVWYAMHRLRVDREAVRDAMVLDRCAAGSNRGYGHALLAVLQTLSRPAPHPGLVGIGESPRHLRRRIQLIASFSPRSRALALVGLTLLVTLIAIGLTEAQSTQPQNTSTSPATQPESAQPQTIEDSEFGQQRLKHLLSQPMTLHLVDEPFDKALDAFRDLGIDIDVDWGAAHAASVRAETPVSLDVEEMPMEEALRLLLNSVSPDPSDSLTFELHKSQVKIRLQTATMQSAIQSRTIHAACLDYAKNNNGRLPDELYPLYRAGLIGLDDCLSPTADIVEPDDFETWPPDVQRNWIRQNASYVILSGKSLNYDTDEIQVVGKPLHHNNQGMPMAYGDNHVRSHSVLGLEMAKDVLLEQTGKTLEQHIKESEQPAETPFEAPASPMVYVMGDQVTRPGAYTIPTDPPLTALQLLASAGGIKDAAQRHLIVRIVSRDQRTIELPYPEFISGTGAQILLRAGDVLVVESADTPLQAPPSQPSTSPSATSDSAGTLHPTSQPAEMTVEDLGRAFVAAIAEGNRAALKALYITPEEFRTVFAGENVEQAYTSISQAFDASLEQPLAELRNAKYRALDWHFAKEPRETQPGHPFGPLQTQVPVVATDNLRVSITTAGVKRSVKLDTVIKVGTQWRLLSPVTLLAVSTAGAEPPFEAPASQPNTSPNASLTQPEHETVSIVRQFLQAIYAGEYDRALGLAALGAFDKEGLARINIALDLSQVEIAQVLVGREQAAVLTEPLAAPRGPMQIGFSLKKNGNMWLIRDIDPLPDQAHVDDWLAGFKAVEPNAQPLPTTDATSSNPASEYQPLVISIESRLLLVPDDVLEQAGIEIPRNVGDGDTSLPSIVLDDVEANLLTKAVPANTQGRSLAAPRLTIFNGQAASLVIDEELASFTLNLGATVSGDRRTVELEIEPKLTVGHDSIDQQTSSSPEQAPAWTGRDTFTLPDQATLLIVGGTITGPISAEESTTVKDDVQRRILLLVRPTIVVAPGAGRVFSGLLDPEPQPQP
jgi:hypothetical protein